MLKVPDDYLFLIVGPNCWEKGETEEEAKKKTLSQRIVSKLSKYLVYLVDPETVLDQMGYLETPMGGKEPILVKSVQPKR